MSALRKLIHQKLWPMKALSLPIQNPHYTGKKRLSSHSCNFVKNIFLHLTSFINIIYVYTIWLSIGLIQYSDTKSFRIINESDSHRFGPWSF